MKRSAGLMIVLVASVGAGACAPMIGRPMFGAPMYGQPPVVAQPYQPPALGRWDQVMSLKPNFVIEVLAADGTTQAGRFIRADVQSLRFQANANEVNLRREDVIRVDLLAVPHAGATDAQEIATGAAKGALTMAGAMAAIPFLISGKVWVPPARFWAAGAVVGGIDAAQRNRYERQPRTIYVASRF